MRNLFGKLILACLLLSGCRTNYHLTGQTAQRLEVNQTVATDSSLSQMLQPYRQRLDQTMNEVLVQSAVRLDKAKPESALNNLLADALLIQARQRTGQSIDLSHLNYGGIRNSLPQGPIRVSHIFEVMPFDNKITILTLNGPGLLQFLNHFISREAGERVLIIGGARVVANASGIESIAFSDGRTFQASALQPAQTFKVALSDYIAEGGDDAFFLKNAQKREDTGFLIREAFIDYFRQLGKSGQPINPTIDGRITRN